MTGEHEHESGQLHTLRCTVQSSELRVEKYVHPMTERLDDRWNTSHGLKKPFSTLVLLPQLEVHILVHPLFGFSQ